MPRPWILQMLPRRLRGAAYSRLFRNAAVDPGGFADVALAHAPGVRMELCPGDGFHRYLAATGFYELDLAERLLERARGGGLLVDVGANYGYFSLLWAAAGAENRVLALEPEPGNCAALRRNVERNGFSGRVEVREVAAGATSGTVEFSSNSETETGWGSIAPSSGASSAAIPELSIPPKGMGRRFLVPSVRLDELVPAGQRVAALKLDVEGAEEFVLAGASELLGSRRIDRVFFENIPEQAAQLGLEPRGPVRILQAHGYRCEAMDAKEWNWVARPA